ncbi:MAG: hypothetical protein ROO76_23045 [Terriglobia bacterium]|nr:hypothetical protein [Terriglobia bacterium]
MSNSLGAILIAQQPIVIRPELIKIGGDLIVGALLSQIVFWHEPNKVGKSKLRVRRQGFLWVAKTREEWMTECGITRKQYLRAMSVLKQKGLVEVRVMKFGGIAMSHTRLLQENLQKALGLASEGAKGQTEMTLKGTVGCTPKVQPYTEITTEITDIRTCAVNCAKNEQEKTKNKQQEEEGEKTEQQEQEEKMKLLQNEAVPLSSLVSFWQSRIASVGGGFQKQLTGRDRGQLKMLADKVGAQTKDVIQYAVNNWWKFATKASAMSGVGSFPTAPHIGFLLKHHAVAVNLYMGTSDKTIPPTTANQGSAELLEHNAYGSKLSVTAKEKPFKPNVEQLHILLYGTEKEAEKMWADLDAAEKTQVSAEL